MSIPDYQSLMLPVLSASALGGETRIGDIVDRLAEKLALSPEERSELLPSGKQTVFANRVHWAIDGEQLAKLMIRHDVGCRVEDTLQIKKIDEDFFE
jgi:restriction endonuclease Mrr